MDNFFNTEEAKEDKSLSQGNEDDILACAADVLNNATTASASSDTGDDKGQIKEKSADEPEKEKKLKLSDMHVITFDNGIEDFLAE
jgi:uncharacterized protein YfdQ (DUF2303 family)